MKKLKSIILLLCCFCLLTGFTPTPIESVYSQNEELSKLVENQYNIDVSLTLTQYKLELEKELSNEISFNRREILLSQIKSLENALSDYVSDNTSQGYRYIVQDPYKIASQNVSLVLAFFYANGYSLSAELLLQARNNSTVGSQYFPSAKNTNQIKNTELFKKISKVSVYTTSTETFTTSNSNQDLVYAIHKFSYSANPGNRRVQIDDYYDFEIGKYSGIAGVAVNAMYVAQQLGVLKPFYIYIPLYY